MVIYIITKLELGGAQKVCLELLNGCGKEIPTALISGSEGPLVQQVKDNPNTFLLPDFKREVSIKGIISELRSFLKLISILRKLKKNHPKALVHTHSTKAGIIGRWAAFFAGIKTRVHTVHGFGFHPEQNRLAWLVTYLAELITAPITTHFIFVSKQDLETSTKLKIGSAHKKSIIRAAVASELFYPAKKDNSNDLFTVGTIACFKQQKNLLDLLRAFHRVHKQHPKTHLEIIGDGIMRSEIESFIKDHNLTNAVTLLGWQQQVAAFMRNWDTFVLTSLWEGLPCAIIEARLSKLPVIANNVGGINEVVFHAQNGFLTMPGKWHDTATYLEKLLKDRVLRNKLASYDDQLTNFENKTMVKNHLTLYNNLLSNAG